MIRSKNGSQISDTNYFYSIAKNHVKSGFHETDHKNGKIIAEFL